MGALNIGSKTIVAIPNGFAPPREAGLLKLFRRWFKGVPHGSNDIRNLFLETSPPATVTEEAEPIQPNRSEGEPCGMPTWEELPGTDCVAAWAREIADAINDVPGCLSWSLIGPNAILQVQDLDTGATILHRAAVEAGLRFVTIKSDSVLNIEPDNFDSFLTYGPIMLYLEPGSWMFRIDPEKKSDDDVTSVENFRNHLKEFLCNLDYQHPIVFATVVKDFDHVAAPLRSVNFFPRRIAVRPVSPEEAGRLFIEELGAECCASTVLNDVEKVGRLVKDYESLRVRALHVFSLQRLALKAQRLIEFADLVEMAVRGTTESDADPEINPEYLQLVAAHEAGHAVAAMIDSAGINTPEYLSIVPSLGYNGVSVDSFSYRCSQEARFSYKRLRHQVRVYMAGRAAEEVVFGIDNVTSGAAGDLKDATQLAARAFAIMGLAPNMDEEGQSASNLAVVIDEPSPSECAHVENLVRSYLAKEYETVKTMLANHRVLLDTIIEHLLEHKVLHQDELRAIAAKHPIVANT